MALNIKASSLRTGSHAFTAIFDEDGLQVYALKGGRFEIKCGSTHTYAHSMQEISDKINDLPMNNFARAGSDVIGCIMKAAGNQYRLEVRASREGDDEIMHSVEGSRQHIVESMNTLISADVSEMVPGRRYTAESNMYGGDYVVLVPMDSVGFPELSPSLTPNQLYEEQLFTKGQVLVGVEPTTGEVFEVYVEESYPNGTFKTRVYENEFRVYGQDDIIAYQFQVKTQCLPEAENDFRDPDTSLYESGDIPSYNPTGDVQKTAPMLNDLTNYDVIMSSSASILNEFMKTANKVAMLDRSSLNKISVSSIDDDGNAVSGSIEWNVRLASPHYRRSSLITIPMTMVAGNMELGREFTTSTGQNLPLTVEAIHEHLGELADDDFSRSRRGAHTFPSTTHADADIDGLLDGVELASKKTAGGESYSDVLMQQEAIESSETPEEAVQKLKDMGYESTFTEDIDGDVPETIEEAVDRVWDLYKDPGNQFGADEDTIASKTADSEASKKTAMDMDAVRANPGAHDLPPEASDWDDSQINMYMQTTTRSDKTADSEGTGQGPDIADVVEDIIEQDKVLDAIPGGEAEGMEPSEFNEEQLMEGVDVEMEHTDDPEIAAEIALDHQAEGPAHDEGYYDELGDMEEGLEEREEEIESGGTALDPAPMAEDDVIPESDENTEEEEEEEDRKPTPFGKRESKTAKRLQAKLNMLKEANEDFDPLAGAVPEPPPTQEAIAAAANTAAIAAIDAADAAKVTAADDNLLFSYDQGESDEDEIKHMMENPGDFESIDDLDFTDEEAVRAYVYGDDERGTFLWEDVMEMMNELLKERGKGSDYMWDIGASNIGWQDRSGSKSVQIENMEELAEKVFPDTDYTFKVYDVDGKDFTIVLSHHDSPTGESYQFSPLEPIPNGTKVKLTDVTGYMEQDGINIGDVGVITAFEGAYDEDSLGYRVEFEITDAEGDKVLWDDNIPEEWLEVVDTDTPESPAPEVGASKVTADAGKSVIAADFAQFQEIVGEAESQEDAVAKLKDVGWESPFIPTGQDMPETVEKAVERLWGQHQESKVFQKEQQEMLVKTRKVEELYKIPELVEKAQSVIGVADYEDSEGGQYMLDTISGGAQGIYQLKDAMEFFNVEGFDPEDLDNWEVVEDVSDKIADELDAALPEDVIAHFYFGHNENDGDYGLFIGWDVGDQSTETEASKTAAASLEKVFGVDGVMDLVRQAMTQQENVYQGGAGATISTLGEGNERFVQAGTLLEVEATKEAVLEHGETLANDLTMSVPDDLKQANIEFFVDDSGSAIELVATWEPTMPYKAGGKKTSDSAEYDSTTEELAQQMQGSIDYDVDGRGDKATIEINGPKWYIKDRKQYEEIESKIDDFSIERADYEIYMWTDVSGYDYWIEKQDEPNYMMIIIRFKGDVKDSDELQVDVAEAIGTAEDIAVDEYDYSKLGSKHAATGGDDRLANPKNKERSGVEPSANIDQYQGGNGVASDGNTKTLDSGMSKTSEKTKETPIKGDDRLKNPGSAERTQAQTLPRDDQGGNEIISDGNTKTLDSGKSAAKKTADDGEKELWSDVIESVKESLNYYSGDTVDKDDWEKAREQFEKMIADEATFKEDSEEAKAEGLEGMQGENAIGVDNSYNWGYLGPHFQINIEQGKSGKWYGILTVHQAGDIRANYGYGYFFELDDEDQESATDSFIQWAAELWMLTQEVTINFTDGSSIIFRGEQDSDIPYYADDYVLEGADDSYAARFAPLVIAKEQGTDRDDFLDDYNLKNMDEPVGDIPQSVVMKEMEDEGQQVLPGTERGTDASKKTADQSPAFEFSYAVYSDTEEQAREDFEAELGEAPADFAVYEYPDEEVGLGENNESIMSNVYDFSYTVYSPNEEQAKADFEVETGLPAGLFNINVVSE